MFGPGRPGSPARKAQDLKIRELAQACQADSLHRILRQNFPGVTVCQSRAVWGCDGTLHIRFPLGLMATDSAKGPRALDSAPTKSAAPLASIARAARWVAGNFKGAIKRPKAEGLSRRIRGLRTLVGNRASGAIRRCGLPRTDNGISNFRNL